MPFSVWWTKFYAFEMITNRLILLERLPHLARLKQRRLRVFYQILKDIGAQNCVPGGPSLANTRLFWDQKRSMRFLITMQNKGMSLKRNVRRLKIHFCFMIKRLKMESFIYTTFHLILFCISVQSESNL